MNNDKLDRILAHVQTLKCYIGAMEVEMGQDIIDAKFKDKNVNNHIRKFKESLNAIRGYCTFKGAVKVTDFQELNYQRAALMNRVFSFLAVMDVEQLEEFLDAVEEQFKD